MLFAEETTTGLDSSSAGPWDPDIIGLRTCVFFYGFWSGCRISLLVGDLVFDRAIFWSFHQ